MSKLKIEVRRDPEMAKKHLTKPQAMYYNTRQKLIFNSLWNKTKKWHIDTSDNHLIAEEEGNKEYIDSETKKFEKFMYGSPEQLDQGSYRELINDRLLNKVARKIKGYKEKLFQKVMKDSDVYTWCMMRGIYIKWNKYD